MVVKQKRLCIVILEDHVPEAEISWSLEYRQDISVMKLLRDER